MAIAIPEAKVRDISQNYFKAFLVIGMVIAHALQLLTSLTGAANYLSAFINLITFSGFIFSFGYIYQTVYSDKVITFAFALGKIKTTLVAYYISAFAWITLVDHELTLKRVSSLLLLTNPPPYSEFLLAFVMMTAIYFIFRPFLNKLISSPIPMIATCIVLLGISFIPFSAFFPVISVDGREVSYDYYIGLLFGSVNSRYFPAFQYLILFILGMYFQKHKIIFNWKILITSLVGLVLLIGYKIILGKMPSRFPPSPFFIAGSFFFIYVYFLISKNIRSNPFTRILNEIGENTIVYLLLSNLFLFALINTGKVSSMGAVAIAITLLYIIYFIVSSSRSFKNN